MTTRSLLLLASLLAACESSGSSASSREGQKAESVASPVREGQPAPNVELLLQSGQRVPLESLRGKHVVLFFYPEDQTKGCTMEARGVRDAHADFAREGAVVFGVSTQDAASHRAFIDAESLPFDLVVDTDGKVASSFGVEITQGRAARDTVLIDATGVVRKIWRGVSPAEHAELVLAELEKW